MAKDKGREIAPIKPGWIKKEIDEKYLNKKFIQIIVFYVVNSPCAGISYSGKEFKDYGWKKDMWKKPDLKNELFSVAGLIRDDTFVVAKRIDEIKKACVKGKVKKDFHKDRSREKIVIYKANDNEFLSICRHIRNSFAHGRFRIYDGSNEDLIYVMEDGVKHDNEFQVRSRMILKESTLIEWMNILKKNNEVS